MVKYDSKVIYQFAERLYKTADTTVATYTAIFGFVGLCFGGFVFALGGGRGIASFVALLIVLFLLWLGYTIGQEKAFQYRLQAQTALCHVQIEENTRMANEFAAAAPTLDSTKKRVG